MNFPLNFFSDLFFFVLLFAAFYISVAGLKFCAFYLKKRFGKFFKVKRTVPVKQQRRKKPAAIRSIEIDPEEVDRIYVKKIS